MSRLVGILHGTEGPFPYDLIKAINLKGEGKIHAEQIKVGAISAGECCPYHLIIDRISHILPYFREYTRNAFINGTYVINNPFRFHLEKYFAYSVATKIGVKIPRTVIIPTHNYPRGTKKTDLQNLDFPIKWGEIVNSLGGFPLILKPSEGGGWRDVTFVENQEELMDAYEDSGKQVMILQEFINFEHFVRVIVFGKKFVLPIRYNPYHKKDPSQPAYIVDHHHLEPELGEIITQQSIDLCKILDYDANSVEFAIRDGIPYAIDFCNQVPDARPEVVSPHYYKWMVDKMSQVAIDYTINPPPVSAWQAIHPLVDKKIKEKFAISI